jgi:hypothetical protein
MHVQRRDLCAHRWAGPWGRARPPGRNRRGCSAVEWHLHDTSTTPPHDRGNVPSPCTMQAETSSVRCTLTDLQYPDPVRGRPGSLSCAPTSMEAPEYR